MTDSADAIAAVQALIRLPRILERAAGELSLADFRVLSAVAAGEGRASRVATRLAIGRPAISAAVDSLCRRGLLSRSGVDHDQRVDALALTAEGEELRGRVEHALVGVLSELCADTPDGDRAIESLAWLSTAIENANHVRAARLLSEVRQ